VLIDNFAEKTGNKVEEVYTISVEKYPFFTFFNEEIEYFYCQCNISNKNNRLKI